jgi:molybdopterin-guanine dinucleotide biosynthesis protein A
MAGVVAARVGSLAAVVLAGGRAERLGGIDKASLRVDGTSLLDRVLDACVAGGADPVIVVGPRRSAGVPADRARLLRWTREQPPGGGPMAALAAAAVDLRAAAVSLVAVLAADLPGLRADSLSRLAGALRPGVPGAVLRDAGGRPQWLIGVWRRAALVAALAEAGDPRGRSVRSVLGTMNPVAVAARPGEVDDVDTPEDLAAQQQVRRSSLHNGGH